MNTILMYLFRTAIFITMEMFALGMIFPKLNKLKQIFGIGKWKQTFTHERDLKKYTLIRPDKTITLYGHKYHWEKGEVVIKEEGDEKWSLITLFRKTPPDSLGRGYNEVERIKGVVEIKEVVVGQDTWEITIDKAEFSIENVKKERNYYIN